jgi:serine/threonine-protein kinase
MSDSYGVLLFEILTGRRAIAADTVERIFYQILHEPISLDPLAEAGVPERLIAVVRAAIERDPAKRSRKYGGGGGGAGGVAAE